MLNIEDIRRRLRDNPEPIEITNARKKIAYSFRNLEFIEDGHKYFYHKDDKLLSMVSVSAVCHAFEPFVDWDTIKKKYAEKNNTTVDEVTKKWHETNIKSTSNGSLVHLFGEAYMHFFLGEIDLMPTIIKDMQYEDGYLIPYGEKEEAIAKFYEDLFEVKNFFPIMPEAKICIYPDNNLGIKRLYAGTFDMLFGFMGKNNNLLLSIFDWKTNKSLTNDFNIREQKKLLPPFNDDMIVQPLSSYTIQLNCYSLGLRQLGYKIVDRKIVWLKPNGEYERRVGKECRSRWS